MKIGYSCLFLFDLSMAPRTPAVLPVEKGVSVKHLLEAISTEGVANPITIATHLD